MAPEVIDTQKWDQSADIWSLGVLVCTIKDSMLMKIAELFMPPSTLFIDNATDRDLVRQMIQVCGRRDDIMEGGRNYLFALESRVSPYFPKAMSAKERRRLYDFLASMLQVNRLARVPPGVLMSHSWLSEIGSSGP
jgi:serine/threonine protein kinase